MLGQVYKMGYYVNQAANKVFQKWQSYSEQVDMGGVVSAKLKLIYVHPIKGLTPHAASSAQLAAGHGILGDRAFALRFNDAGEQLARSMDWQEKSILAVQNDWPGLARLSSQFDFASGELKVRKDGVELLSVNMNNEGDLKKIDAFFTTYIATLAPSPSANHATPAPVNIIGAADGARRYPDRIKYQISLLNLASLRDVSQQMGIEVDARRFRCNLLVDGLKPWEEFDLLNKELRIGSALVRMESKIARCHNVNVDPDTGDDTAQVLKALATKVARGSFGVIGNVLESGKVESGDELKY